MIICLLTAAANLAVGALVGLCGVAGFLLPMFYTASLGMNVSEGLALSFAAFIVSGVLGSWNYKKAGNLDLAFGLRLSAGILASSLVTGVSPLILSKRSVIHHLHAPRFPRNGLSSSGKIVPTCIALSN